MSKLIELLKYEAKELNNSFEKASIEGRGTPQEISDRREIALTKLLRKYFPFPYRIAKGNIIDSYNESSASIDIILLNPSHPFTVSSDSKFSVILADGVDIAIELKPDLVNDTEITRALKQVHSVKKLKRQRTSLLKLEMLTKTSEELYENSKRIPSIIFANKTYKENYILLEKIVSYYEKNKLKREFQFDILVVNNRFIVLNSKKDFIINFENVEDGFYIVEYGELTLAAFIMYLNQLPQTEMRWSKSVIEHYLNFSTITNTKEMRFYEDLNKRLCEI